MAEYKTKPATTAYIDTLLDDPDAASGRSTLGCVIGTNVQAYSARLSDIASTNSAQGDVLVGGVSGWSKISKPSVLSFLTHTGSASVPAWCGYRFIVKTQDEQCASNAGTLNHVSTGSTMTDDYHLQASLQSGKTYAFFLRVSASSSTTPDFKCDMSYTGTGTTAFSISAQNTVTPTVIHYTSFGTASSHQTTSSGIRIVIWGFVTTTSSGALKFRWAQNTASTTLTYVYAGSCMQVMEA